jgi:hydroxypyruvate isomerase
VSGKRAACIEDGFLFKELPFSERFAAAAEAGFDSVEFWSWRGRDLDEVAERAAAAGIEVGCYIGTDRGSAIDPADLELYLKALGESLGAAARTGTPALYIFSDEIGQGGMVKPVSPGLSADRKMESLVRAVSAAADLAEGAGVTLLLEPVNSVYVPNYFMDTVAAAVQVVRRVDRPDVKAVYDLYHQQLVAGNLIQNLRAALPYIGCIHVADVPGRHEPGTGEINFSAIAREMAALSYDGTIMFECQPRASTAEALAAIGSFFPRP